MALVSNAIDAMFYTSNTVKLPEIRNIILEYYYIPIFSIRIMNCDNFIISTKSGIVNIEWSISMGAGKHPLCDEYIKQIFDQFQSLFKIYNLFVIIEGNYLSIINQHDKSEYTFIISNITKQSLIRILLRLKKYKRPIEEVVQYEYNICWDNFDICSNKCVLVNDTFRVYCQCFHAKIQVFIPNKKHNIPICINMNNIKLLTNNYDHIIHLTMTFQDKLLSFNISHNLKLDKYKYTRQRTIGYKCLHVLNLSTNVQNMNLHHNRYEIFIQEILDFIKNIN